MGTVYYCQNSLVEGIEAAVKTMDPSMARSKRSRQRFVREAEVLFDLDHPHIVKVRNVHMNHDPPFLEMDFVVGKSLGALLGDQSLTVGAATTIAAQLCSAVGYLHARRVSHRDIKPDNVIVAGEHATLVDFGLVSEDHHATISRPGSLFGTLRYVPPEWGGVERPDGVAWDLYSLGVLLYELFTGTPAFAVPHDLPFSEQLMCTRTAKHAAPHLDLGPTLPPDARQVVKQLTAVNPSLRHCDLAGAAEVLKRLREQMPDAVAEQKPAVKVASVPQSEPTWQSSLADDMVVLGSAHRLAGRPGAPTAVPEWSVDRESEPDKLTDPSSESSAPIDSSSQADSKPGATLVPEQGPPARATVDSGPASPTPASMSHRLLWTAAAVVAVICVGGGVWMGQPENVPPSPTTWPLRLHLSPALPALPVDLQLDGRPIDLHQAPALSPGPHSLRILIGQDCDEQSTPTHCVQILEDFIVGEDGLGAERRVRLPEVVARQVVLEPQGPSKMRARLADGDWSSMGASVTWNGLLPGIYSGVGQAGECPDLPCGTDCPPVCSEVPLTLTVPFADAGRLRVTLVLPTPAVPKTTPPPRKERTPPRFSVGRIGKWLEKNPGYQRDAAISSGLASSRYLRGWQGTSPPKALASGATIGPATAVEAVSPVIAARACRGRGGLLSVDASPTTWTVPSGGAVPWFEIRQSSAGPVLLQSDGTQLPVGSTDARPMVGFRCAR